MQVINFHFGASPGSNDDQVRPIIDGADFLLTLADGSLGIDPPEFFQQSAFGARGKLLVGRCSCGVVGCGDVQADVDVGDHWVTWRFPGGRTYHFELQQYLESFKRASANTAWESVGRAAERLVSSLDFEKLEENGYRFEWASSRVARGRMTLSFLKDGNQRLFEVGWNELDASDAKRQVHRWLEEFT